MFVGVPWGFGLNLLTQELLAGGTPVNSEIKCEYSLVDGN